MRAWDVPRALPANKETRHRGMPARPGEDSANIEAKFTASREESQAVRLPSLKDPDTGLCPASFPGSLGLRSSFAKGDNAVIERYILLRTENYDCRWQGK